MTQQQTVYSFIGWFICRRYNIRQSLNFYEKRTEKKNKTFVYFEIFN
jgi:hypothetical protein